MSPGNTFGAWIRRMLATRGMTIAELARRSGINRSTLSGYVNQGPGNIQRGTVLLIAKALEASSSEALLAAGNITEDDPELELIRLSDLPEHEKERMLRRVRMRRIEDLERRLADIQYQIDLAKGRESEAGSDVG